MKFFTSDHLNCDYPEHDLFPHYGVAPHTHDLSGGIIGSTRTISKDKWPNNFIEDPKEPGCGTYICPRCLGTGLATTSHRLSD